ncbi:DinB family protein [Flavobacterium granuli]|uniref:Damage-inducible protein DinB n=1 Tax=Flavobacterium granuli TaxID=280093 RepID=A0A1M5K7T2_9FLAO|nr:DinB family protein [Flavobacterium granuli]PRZ26190.1 putative damage-inducible protein DinB [Flavobacterium granuli]SHG48731.1 Uncharacterized damage-inducible protein DinB (forms a four-helix bundle) [Flavobacterium granuli]
MKKIVFLLAFLFTNLVSAQKEVVNAFVEKWDNSKVYLVKMTESMPEDKFDFKPTDREMTFKEQLMHILDNMDWLSTTHFSNGDYKKKDRTAIVTKQQIVEEIGRSFDEAKIRVENNKETDLGKKVVFFAGEKTKLQILNLLQDHVTHHRGQLIVYLNLNQIKPPAYVGW